MRSNSPIIIIDMKTFLLIAALSIWVCPTGAFADSQTSEIPGDHSRQTTAVSKPAEAPTPRAKVKAFIHPETGEILTYEQWQALGIENDEAEAASRSSSDTPQLENSPTVLQGRQIDLGNGDYIILVDTPDSEMVETKVWFDDEGKAHIRCNH